MGWHRCFSQMLVTGDYVSNFRRMQIVSSQRFWPPHPFALQSPVVKRAIPLSVIAAIAAAAIEFSSPLPLPFPPLSSWPTTKKQRRSAEAEDPDLETGTHPPAETTSSENLPNSPTTVMGS